MKKKIVFVLTVNSLPVPASKGGAIETLLSILLFENEKKGIFSLIFIAPDSTDEVRNYRHSRVYLLKKNRINYEYDYRACRIVKEENPDFVVMEGNALRLDGCFRDVISSRRLGLHIHHDFERKGFYCDSFGVSIVPSEFLYLKWNSNDELNKNNTYILRNAIDLKRFQKRITPDDRVKLREKLGVNEDDYLVFFCGRLIPQKGIRELVEAISVIEDPSVKLLIIGSDSFADGNEKDYAKEIVEDINNNKHCIYLGYIDNNELYKYYNISDVQIIPSLWEEVFGLVAVEGMASGLPIIYTDSGALPEIIGKQAGIEITREGDIIRQIKESIILLKNDNELASSLGKYGQQKSANYDASNYYDNFSRMINWWTDRIYKDEI